MSENYELETVEPGPFGRDGAVDLMGHVCEARPPHARAAIVVRHPDGHLEVRASDGLPDEDLREILTLCAQHFPELAQ